MIIVAGALYVDPVDRQAYLAACSEATAQARLAPGCLDFAQSPDQIDPRRINIFERWESDEHLLAFRGDGAGADDLPDLLDADVKEYRISAVEGP